MARKLTAVLLTAVTASISTSSGHAAEPIVVEVEDVVTTWKTAGNGAGPLWCYGSALIVRRKKEVFASSIETGDGVPLLCNTRWQVFRRNARGWSRVAHEERFREREPCPIALLGDGTLLLSANPSTEPPGTKYGPCSPRVIRFSPNASWKDAVVESPKWPGPGTPTFTDHSYRGFASDASTREALLLNIDARTSAQHVSFRDAKGSWRARDPIVFPIRAAYPQVALRDGAAHVLAIGDIVEPVAEWRALKREKTGQQWDYVFRRLFYAHSKDIRAGRFERPVEIASVESTGGHITNLDLHVDAAGDAHVLFTEGSVRERSRSNAILSREEVGRFTALREDP